MANKKKPAKELVTAPHPDSVSAELDSYLRADAIVSEINKHIGNLPPIPQGYVFKRRDKEVVSAAFHACFELSGGVPNMVAWARDNPTQFFNLYSKLLPSNTETPVAATTVIVQSSIPVSKLDAVTIDKAGNVVEAETIDFDETPE